MISGIKKLLGGVAEWLKVADCKLTNTSNNPRVLNKNNRKSRVIKHSLLTKM